jgi:hypothetical protein
MSVSELFDGYATRELVGGDRLQTTPIAAETMAEAIVTYRTPELEAVLLTEIMDLISVDCLPGKAIDELLALYTPSYPRERVIFTIYAMLKQGLLRLL